MGLQIRDNRQRKALTGLSQAQFDHLLPFFSDIYEATQQKTYEEGVESGTRKRKPGGGSKGKLPTMADKLQFVLYYYALLTLFGKNPKNQLISLDLKMDISMETVTFLPVRPWVHRTAYPQKMGLRGGLLSKRGLPSAFRYARLFS